MVIQLKNVKKWPCFDISKTRILYPDLFGIKFFSFKMQDTDKTNDLGPLEEDVDKTYDEISSYMNIVKKTMFDMVPKAITLYVIRNLEKFIKTDLLVKVTGVLSDENVSIFLKFVV